MKVSKLIELLNVEDQDAEVIAYLGAEDGWEMAELGLGDAILGKCSDNDGSVVLIPVQVPSKLQPWEDAKRID